MLATTICILAIGLPQREKQAERGFTGTWDGRFSVDRERLRGYNRNKGSLEIGAAISRAISHMRSGEWIELTFSPGNRYRWRIMNKDGSPWTSGSGGVAGSCYAGTWTQAANLVKFKHTQMLSDFDENYKPVQTPRYSKLLVPFEWQAEAGKDGSLIQRIDPLNIARLTFTRKPNAR